MKNNNVLKFRELHNRGIDSEVFYNPLVCPYPRKYFAYIRDGMFGFSCGVFSSFLDYCHWFESLSDSDLFINGVQFSKDQINFTNVCRLG